MRATQLQFRSPKQRTPGPYKPKVTYDGRNLTPPVRPSSLSKAKRFAQYQTQANKTGYRLGPGAYQSASLRTGTPRIIKTPIYKPSIGHLDTKNNSYVMIGNHMMCQPDCTLNSSKKLVSTKNGINQSHYISHSLIKKKKPLFSRNSTPEKLLSKKGRIPYYTSR